MAAAGAALRDRHAQRAREIEQLARLQLDATIPIGRAWIIVMLFYAALHWVEAYLASKGLAGVVRDHTARANAVQKEANLRRIYRQYRELQDAAWEARYTFRTFTSGELAARQKDYDTVRQHIEPLI